ncbi:MAG: mandelate racemase/muconate lactonizing enzyme family protein [Acidobacteria bacterium]|nr:mandelate racemase/muconate lactonizing enzyme family protein [Acidobacteriota bacterium]MCI0718714.1 mandelate racemase/muconate lactonizing enzyme family protein [Acidobacteriota bacterium]
MKITDVETIYLRLPQVREEADCGQDALIVLVHTDAGITGIGEVDSSPMAVHGVIQGPYSHAVTAGLKGIVVGEDPFETEKIWHKMYQKNIYSGRRGIAIHAMGGIDMALWDIKGKALNLPVWKLLGGGFHRKIRAYASILFGDTPGETGERGRRMVDLGFSAVKFGWGPLGKNEADDLALVREARKGIGDRMDLMIDAGLCYDAKTAMQRARQFEEYDPFWFEEPLQPDNYEGYRRLSESTSMRIAAGEEESSRLSYIDLMDRGKIDIVQVDLTRCGGFTEAMKIASLAADRGLPCVNHGFTTYINIAASLHFLASITNSFILEYVVQEQTKLRDEITFQEIRAVDGWVKVPQEPGLGVRLNAEAIARYRQEWK